MKWRSARLFFAGLFCTVIMVGAAHAQINEPDRAALLDEAFERLRSAGNVQEARAAEAEIWALWQIGPNADATAALAAASRALQAGALTAAHRALDALLAVTPDFMEALNQRAFAKFLKGDLYGALTDIRATLAREPRHFGALAGRAPIEMRLGRPGDAARTHRDIGQIHPWMNGAGPHLGGGAPL